ncbi:MAG: polyisoprenoid-binding protein [Alphaproteobacteria bacterium]|nr:polyisoprenoid-binding protein [Alphaproteobacteria bacterium]
MRFLKPSSLLCSALALGVLAMPRLALAETERYDFDKVHTQILFFVDHLGFSKSHGKFLDFDGGFVFDREHPENSNIDVVIKTDGLDMDDEKWDEHLKGPDFFNVEKFPDMRFKSTSIAVTGDQTADVTGDLTLLGVTKPVTLHVVHNKSGKHPFGGKYISGFSATAHLNRSDFGMNYGVPAIGDEVQIRIEVEGVRQEEGIEQSGEKGNP